MSLQRSAVAVLLYLVSAGVMAREWTLYTSDNFAIYSDAHDGLVEQMLTDFEVFRSISLSMLGFKSPPDASRLRIMMYGSSSDYRALVDDEALAGFYLSESGNPRMVIGPKSRQLTLGKEILFHEYVHFLQHQYSRILYPPWYREGLADLLGPARVRQEVIRVGEVPTSRVDWLRLEQRMSVEDLIRPRSDQPVSDDYVGRFYASAWLLTHFLLMNSYGEHPEYRRSLVDYLRRINRGEEPLAAFEPAFGMTPRQMDSLIDRYQRRTRVTMLDFPNTGYTGAIDRRVLNDTEVAAAKADIAWLLGKESVALDLLKDFDPSSAQGAGAATALAMRAVLRQHEATKDDAADQAKLAVAEEDRKAALASPATDPTADGILAHYLIDRYDALAKAGNPETSLLDEAEDLASRALQADKLDARAHWFLAMARERRGDIAAANDTLAQAYKVLPYNPGLNLNLAERLIKAERYDEALILAEEVLAASHGTTFRARVQDLIEQIRSGKVDLAWFKDEEFEN